MATLNFLYRSNKQSAALIARLLFRHADKDFVYGCRTQLFVDKDYWSKQHTLKRPKDISIVNKQNDIRRELNKIENYILDAYRKAEISEISKTWLERQIDLYYNPHKANGHTSSRLTDYLSTYVEHKKTSITESTVKKSNVIRQMVLRYEEARKTVVHIKNIDANFKTDFERYCLDNNYAPNTIARSIRFVKTVCKYAKMNGLETHPNFDLIKVKYHKTETIYLTKQELDSIAAVELNESLANARDWLLISCETGQRVSDFMRFKKDWIRYETNKEGILKPLIEFTQKKTQKRMTVPLSQKVMAVLNHRKGEFPKAISDQKYNDYIKEVCKLAGLTQSINGSKKLETASGSKIYRKETGNFQKWELVSSHIGRRSFATNNYGYIPTSFLIYITGHSTETMFLNYIGKSNKDIAMELTNYL